MEPLWKKCNAESAEAFATTMLNLNNMSPEERKQLFKETPTLAQQWKEWQAVDVDDTELELTEGLCSVMGCGLLIAGL